jgi:16S rRNA (cytosine1402-N4)-methyltransferase
MCEKLDFKYHIPVLLNEVVDALKTNRARLIVDVTLGDGGYSKAILDKLPSAGMVVGIDRDMRAIKRATKRLENYSDHIKVICGNFSQLKDLLENEEIGLVYGVVADLGISTLQITDPNRGFMFSKSGPLSMQMGGDSEISAEHVVNEFDEEELANIFYRYGEERASRKIASAIVKYRRQKYIATTSQLADVVGSVIGGKFKIKSQARIFQAIRIYVNKELECLEKFLPQAIKVLKSGGRLCVISYHSLEDRMVKQFISQAVKPCICPPDLPLCVCGKTPLLRKVGKMISPTQYEVDENPNSRSAKLRVAEKL